jgi:carnitine O-acetyltransferase
MSKLGLRTNATHAYVEDYSKGPMLRYQDSLPKLPVPTLEETAVRYLKSVKAVATPEQYAKTEQALKEFLRGPGPRLQSKLLQKAADPEVKNWLADWWNDGAYLTYRDAVVPYVSYFYSHKDDKLRKTPASRAAAISTAALSFKKQVDEKTLEPEYMKKMPLCMDAYKYMFNVCRVAYEGRDDAVVYPASENKHIIVIRKNKFYKVLHEVDGREVTTGELEVQFQRVIDLAGSDNGIAIGAMTSENRDKWAQFRKLLLAQGNESALKEIESASFVVCLDDSTPVTREERAHQYWHGDGQNRFYDKPVQFIVCDNGASGFMGEHSMMDGTQTHRLNDYVCDVISNNKIEFPTGDKSLVASTLAEPELVKFNVNDEIKSAVETSINDFDKEINKHELAIFNYQGYGKGLIKQFKASPDGYVQMLLQLAYYKYYGVNRPTYESAATRRFQLGRTETCRSVSEESVKFCQTFEDPNATVEQKLSAVRNALAAHGKYITDASAGKGVDRHLFGLKKLVDPSEPLPSLYADPMYTYSSSWYISSSQLSSEHFNGYGWSQVIDDGFGLAYMINENSLNINIVSKKLGSEKMKHYLNEAADDMAQVFSTELKSSKL